MTKEKGLSLVTILFVVILTLKLTGNIDWSWWWVLLPYWLPAFGFVLLLITILIVQFFNDEKI